MDATDLTRYVIDLSKNPACAFLGVMHQPWRDTGMDAIHPRVRVVERFCAPKTFPCPRCGKRGRRKDTHTRRVRDIAYREIVWLN